MAAFQADDTGSARNNFRRSFQFLVLANLDKDIHPI